ncbi:MAG: hypothetical protein ABR985_12085 [Methanotrichaceae archaeon]|jgi:hypothetical protein
MVRCKEFYEKWKKAGNFCEVNPKAAANIERYLDELIKIEPIGSVNISEGAARPLYQEKDSKVHDEAVKQVIALAVTKKADGKEPTVTAPEVKKIIEKVKGVPFKPTLGDEEKCKLTKDCAFLLCTIDTLIDECGWSINQIKHVVDYRELHGDGTLPFAPLPLPDGAQEKVSTQMIKAHLLDLISSFHKYHDYSFDDIRRIFFALVSEVENDGEAKSPE